MPARKKLQNTSKKKCKATKPRAKKKALAKTDAPAPNPPTDPAAITNEIVKWILAGQNEADIREAIAEHFPAAVADDLIMNAMNAFAKSSHFDRDIIIGFCFQATRDLYRRMVDIADYPAALRALKQLLEMAEKYGEIPEAADV